MAARKTEHKHLQCDMTPDCADPVTYIDTKGWIYCTTHTVARQGFCACRRLSTGELIQLSKGETIAYRKARQTQ